MRQSLADPAAYGPNTGALAGRHLQDSRWGASDVHRHGQSSAESEPRNEHVNMLVIWHAAMSSYMLHGTETWPVKKNNQ